VIFECWYLGQECGHAVADVLFGDYNPGGKLPITIPRPPAICRRSTITSRRPGAAYLFDDVTPLYPFGFGLSYTTFAFKNVRLEKKAIRRANPRASWWT
jgi:beta-glucosidase